MDAIAVAIQNGQASPVPAEMGLRDMKIMRAVYEAMESGQKVPL
jgi:predicted dehydrogenase